MARKSSKSILNVALNGYRVGVLIRASNGAISFTYDTNWLDSGRRSIPVSLSMPLREEPYKGTVVSSFFENLLPDNTLIRRKVAEKVGAQGIDAFSLLNKIGRDCVGALQFIPDGYEILPPGKPEYKELSIDDVSEIIRNLASSPLGVNLQGQRELRISIAGAQEKTALFKENGWNLPMGSTPTTHIIKPTIGKLPNGLDMSDSVDNEHYCLVLCKNLGLDVAASEIVNFGGSRVLAVERFDRIKTTDGRMLRIPQEDFCQSLSIPSTLKYNNEGGPGIKECMGLLRGSDFAEKDRREFMKAQLVFWLIGATDGHAKNFSVFLNTQGRYRMTPLYDIISLQPNYHKKELRKREYKLAMVVGNGRKNQIDNIFPWHFHQSAKIAGFPSSSIDDIINELVRVTIDAIDKTLNKMPNEFNIEIANAISKGLIDRLSRLI